MMLSSCLIILVAIPVFALASTNSNSNKESDNVLPAGSRIPIYRYYSSHLIDHYYTTDYIQSQPSNDDSYKFEGIGFYLISQQDEFQNYLPLYQYYDSSPLLNHYFTTNPNPLQIGDPNNYLLGFCYPEEHKQVEMVPLYRYYQEEHVDHLYTTSKEEMGSNLKVGDFGENDYQYQGIECYVFSSSGDSIIEDVSGLEEMPIIKEIDDEISKDIQFNINGQGGDDFDAGHDGDMNINGADDDLNGDYDGLQEIEAASIQIGDAAQNDEGLYLKINDGDNDSAGDHNESAEIEPVGIDDEDDVEQDMAIHFPLKDKNENENEDKDGEVSMDYKFILISGDDIRNHWGVYAICGLFVFVGIIVIFTHFGYKYSVSTKLDKDKNEYEPLV